MKDNVMELAPCGLCCRTCLDYKNGAISECAKELIRLTTGVSEFKHKNHFKDADSFDTMLFNINKLANPKCNGCRNGKGGCTIDNCCIMDCAYDHKVNFCGECLEFPCDKVDMYSFPKYDTWLKINKQIAEVGATEVYDEVKDKPHYEE